MKLLHQTPLLLALCSTACVTAPTKPEFKESQVLERQNHASEVPEWAASDTVMTESGGQVLFLSEMTMNGNARTEACFKGAELDARSHILRHIKEALTSSGQLNETDATSDPGLESLTAYLSSGNLSGVKSLHRYWEKIEQSDAESGQRQLKLRCVVQVGIKKSDLQRQLQAALGGGGDTKLRNTLHDQQMKFLEGTGNADAEKAVAH